jgi:RNA polymerase sigma factor (sigma-70 family)
MEIVLGHLRRAVLRQDGRTDGQLLASFIDQRDEAAFEALVHRHGPMVFGVCRRLVRNHHDAEDAFQATFLVLARKASSVRPPERLAGWLHGVALRIALKAKAMTAKRRAREKQVTQVPDPETAQQDQWCDLRPLLDQELSGLPENYRLPILLCDLEGKTIKEATEQLGWPQGTLAGRLSRGRKLLAKRLANRGVVLSAGSLATVVAQNVASAGLPAALVSSTVKATALMAAGQATLAEVVPAKVAALMEGAMKAMSLTKFKTAFVLMVVVCVLGWGGGVIVWQTQAKAMQEVPAIDLPVAVADLGGTWQGDDWGTVVLRRTKEGEFAGTYTDTFGKDVGRIAVRWSSASRRYEGTWSEGKFRFGRIALEAAKDGDAISGAYTTDPKCEHQPGVPSLASLRWSRVKSELAPRTEKKGFTAWGKEVGGVQAGLGYRPGQRRAYHTGETVRLVVRVRNVGKKEVKLSYFNEFFYENPPAVTDGEGKPVLLEGAGLSGLAVLVNVNLAPGKEVEFCELNLALRPASERGKRRPVWTLFGTGKFQLQCERVGGNIGTGQIKFDPVLSKLATGKLDLEIKSEPPAAKQLNKTLIALDKQLWDAAKTGDPKVYDRLLANDFIGHSALYGRSDKTATVRSVKNRRYSDWTIRDVETKEISKDVAILTYVYSCKVTSVADGSVQTYKDHRTSLVWARRVVDGDPFDLYPVQRWVLVFCQETTDAKAVPAADPGKPAFRPGAPDSR